MNKPANMTNDQLTKWLQKTVQSVNTFMCSGGSLNTSRGYDLADRYEELMDEAKERNYRGVNLWETYCD